MKISSFIDLASGGQVQLGEHFVGKLFDLLTRNELLIISKWRKRKNWRENLESFYISAEIPDKLSRKVSNFW